MKKTAALIYRLIFVILSVWALWSLTNFSSVRAFSDISVFSAAVNMLAVFAVFLWGIKSAPPETVFKMKAVFAVLAAAVLFINRGVILDAVSLWWILRILLPLMAVLDWILFDKKGNLRISDMLLWLLATLGLLAILGFDVQNALSALLPALVFSGLMLLLDSLFSGKKGRKNTIPLLLKLIFLALECWAFYILSGKSVESFVNNLKYYTAVSNLLAFSVVAVSVLVGFLGFKKAGSYLTRIKGCFTVLLLIASVIYFGYLTESSIGIYHMLHSIICPALLLVDYFVFDSRGCVKAYDPLWWAAPVFVYAGYIVLIAAPVFGDKIYASVSYIDFAMLGALAVVMGYVMFAFDKLVKKVS